VVEKGLNKLLFTTILSYGNINKPIFIAQHESNSIVGSFKGFGQLLVDRLLSSNQIIDGVENHPLIKDVEIWLDDDIEPARPNGTENCWVNSLFLNDEISFVDTILTPVKNSRFFTIISHIDETIYFNSQYGDDHKDVFLNHLANMHKNKTINQHTFDVLQKEEMLAAIKTDRISDYQIIIVSDQISFTIIPTCTEPMTMEISSDTTGRNTKR